jgi:hypothetical protein
MIDVLDEDFHEFAMLMRSTPPKGCFEYILREMAKDNEDIYAAVADILLSSPPKEAIEKIKQWRKI